jgi:hypothetical protein
LRTIQHAGLSLIDAHLDSIALARMSHFIHFANDKIFVRYQKHFRVHAERPQYASAPQMPTDAMSPGPVMTRDRSHNTF